MSIDFSSGTILKLILDEFLKKKKLENYSQEFLREFLKKKTREEITVNVGRMPRDIRTELLHEML